MCGIAGGIHSGLSREQAAQALSKMAHRGPDDHGLWMNEQAWLGNTRLAIQDVSERGHQPMQTPDGRYTLVFNGEIYNHSFLRKKLEQHGVMFRSSCDTETLLHAYAAWGRNCLEMLEGDFAFTVHDAEKAELFIARDPLGVKPLYYYDDGKQILFASEIKALTSLPGLDYSLRPEVFFQYLLFQYAPSADTPFRFIQKLLPGHCLRIDLNAPLAAQPERFYRIPFSRKAIQNRPVKAWTKLLDDALTKAVSQRLHADVPVGIMLAGGLDSSLIAALARKAQPDAAMHAFTINTQGDMKEEGFADDFAFAQLIAQRLGIMLHEIPGHINIANELDNMIWHLDEPQADPAALHTAHIAKAAREIGFKVLLSGTGGDDVFSGYRRHAAIPYLQKMQYMPQGLGGIVAEIARRFPANTKLRRLAKLASGAGLSPDEAAVHTHFWTEPDSIRALFLPDIIREQPSSFPYRMFKELLHEIPDEHNLLQKMLFWELRTFLPHHNLAYMDKLAIAHSIEVRVPFGDTNIVSLASQMPPRIKLRGQTTKYILREMAKAYLPSEIIHRKKTGFGAPLRQWMKGDLQKIISERILDESFLRRGIFSRAGIEQLINDNMQGRTDSSYTLFSLLSIESWLRQFVPSA